MKQGYPEQLRHVLEEAVKAHGSIYRLAKESGVSKVNIGRWLRGVSPRSAEIAPVIELMGAELRLPGEALAEYDLVPRHAAKAGAGASLETSDATEGFYAFRKDWLGQKNIHAGSAVLLTVTGDSMEPLFREGDTLLVDKNDREIVDGRIYVVTLGEELRVKRVQKGVSGLILHSENPRYADVHVCGPDLEAFRVHGRVRWVGKEL